MLNVIHLNKYLVYANDSRVDMHGTCSQNGGAYMGIAKNCIGQTNCLCITQIFWIEECSALGC